MPGNRDQQLVTEGSGLIRLGVVDDHPVFRLGLIGVLEREPDMAVAWEAGSVAELDSLMESHAVDIILMDIGLGWDDGLAATRAIRKSRPSTAVIIISGSLDWEATAAAREAGAIGYLPKDLAVADIVAAIRAIASPTQSKLAFTDMLAQKPGVNRALLPWRSGLSKREQEVLAQLRRGRSNKEIAQRLGVSITTVNKHVHQILRKLQVRTRSQAIAIADAEAAGRGYLIAEVTPPGIREMGGPPGRSRNRKSLIAAPAPQRRSGKYGHF